MIKPTMRWIAFVLLIGAVLGCAYVIVERNNAAMGTVGSPVPSGLMH